MTEDWGDLWDDGGHGAIFRDEPAWCQWCGETLPEVRHAQRKYCNDTCMNAYFNDILGERRSKERAAKRRSLRCVQCGDPIQGAQRSNRIYCSRKCSRVKELEQVKAKRRQTSINR